MKTPSQPLRHHVPRPPNAFMIFRSDLCHKLKSDPTAERDHRTISVVAGILWRDLPQESRKEYEQRALDAKKRHAIENPGYKYLPLVRRQKPIKRRVRNDPEDERERCIKIASVWMKDFVPDATLPSTTTDSNAAQQNPPTTIPGPSPLFTDSTPRSLRLLPSPGEPSNSSLISAHTPPTPELLFDFSSPFTPLFALTPEIPSLDLSYTATEPQIFGEGRESHALDFPQCLFQPHFEIQPEASCLQMPTNYTDTTNCGLAYSSARTTDASTADLPNPFFNFFDSQQPAFNDDGWALFDHPPVHSGQFSGSHYSTAPVDSFPQANFGTWFGLE